MEDIKEERFQFYNEDCFETFKRVKDKSLDLVIVDLPYGQTACKWDIIIPFDEMWKELKRIAKPNANYLFFCTTKFGFKIIESNPKWFRYDIVWEKSRVVGFLSAKKSLMRNHEMIYLFGKPSGGKKTYNPQMVEGTRYNERKRCDNKLKNNCYGKYNYKSEINTGTRYPRSVVKVANPNNHSIHPTQKPVEIYDWLIKTYSNENDLVMDFCLGSGTGLISAMRTNRRFIGCELNKEYFDKIKERYEEE